MYNFIRSYTKKNKEWTLHDVSNETLDFIDGVYESVRIVATQDADVTEFEIHMNDLRMELFLVDKTQTVLEWLASYSEPVLPTRMSVKRLKDVRNVKFTDISGYNLTIKAGNHLYAEGITSPKNSDHDLECYSELPEYDARSMRNLGDNSVIAVNGHICKTTFSNGRLWALDASTYVKADTAPVFSVIDFTDIGGCEKVYLNNDNTKIALRSLDEERRYLTRAVVDTGISMQGKTPVIVIDGHLYIGNDTIKPISDTEVVIDVSHPTVLSKANDHTIERLGFVDSPNARENGLNLLTMDVSKLLTETDSFVILINTSELCVQREKLEVTNIEGFYTHYRAPTGLCMFENGRLAPYQINDYNAWTVCVATGSNIRRNMLWDTVKWEDLKVMWDVEAENGVDHKMEAEIIDLYVF